MTAKERVLVEAPGWTEEQAQAALVAVERTRPGDIVDEWGNLSAMTRASAARAMRRLDEEERTEFGETLVEAWEREQGR